MIETIDFKREHYFDIERREADGDIKLDVDNMIEGCKVLKTVMWDDKILTIFGLTKDDGLFQIASKHIKDAPMEYAKGAKIVTDDIIKDLDGVYSMCLNDEFHERWMAFIGFGKVDDLVHTIDGKEYVFYGVSV